MNISKISRALKLILILLTLVPLMNFRLNDVSAHPGNTDSNGGHVCRTNCPSWVYDYGEYHLHSSAGSSTSSLLLIVALGGLGYFFYRAYQNNSNSE